MAQTVRELMTTNPITFEEMTPVAEAAKAMRNDDIGVVVVVRNGDLRGVVTDRDIVVRGLAENRDPTSTPIGEIASRDLVTVSPNDPSDTALRQMRERAIRRVVVTEGNRPVGILSLGDVALETGDTSDVLASISSAPGNS